MIFQFLEEQKDFTPNEQVIADYILNNTSKVIELTAEELAMETYTSKATVLRLCKKIGVKGYRDFIRLLNDELKEKYRISALIDKNPINNKSTLQDIVETIPSIYETAVGQTKLLFDLKALQRTINYLRDTSILEIYGTGIDESLARMAMFKFNTIGIPAMAFEGLNEHYVMANKDRKNKTAIVLTFSGHNSYIIYASRYLKKCHYTVIGIGGNEHDELSDICDEYIEIYTKELILGFEVLSTYTAMNYVLDILFSSLLASQYKKNVDVALQVVESRK